MTRVSQFRGHPSLHRLWAYARLRFDLRVEEYFHIVHCERCWKVVRTSLEADNFAAILKDYDGAEPKTLQRYSA